MSSTERRINAAAVRMFAERGNTDLTVSELAAEAGVARGTVSRSVASVDQLFDQVRVQIGRDTLATAAQALADAGIADPPLRLATAIRMLVRLAHADPAMGRFLVRFGLSDEALREILTGPPLQDIRDGVADGQFTTKASDELSIASLIIGSMISAMWLVIEGHQTWRQAGTGTAELVLRALGVPSDVAHEHAHATLPDMPAL